MKYINETCDYGIPYSYDANSLLVGYCDAGWVVSANDRKSTPGGYFLCGNNLISWFEKKQNQVSLYTTKGEYIIVGRNFT